MTTHSECFMVRFWGVRGSVPTPGPHTIKYGGNTTCIEVRCDDRVLVIDTGTGARPLGNRLLSQGFHEASIIYSHLHLDHIQGFPFFAPIYSAENTLHIYAVVPDEMSPKQVLASQMTYPSFPVGLSNLPADIRFHELGTRGSFQLGEARIFTCPINHPGGAIAIRIDHRGHSFVQCSDLEHEGDLSDPALVDFVRGADALSYDSMYVEGEEYNRFRGWGHSTWNAGVRLSNEAQVGTFVAFHHEPDHDDAFMDQVAKDVSDARPGSLVAREGMVMNMLTGHVTFEDR